MPSTVTLDTKGLNALIAAMPGREADVVRVAAYSIEEEAKKKAPVDTGNLRNSIRSGEFTQTSAEVTVSAEYGAHVEYGTRRQRAQPYLTPAVKKADRDMAATAARVLFAEGRT